ncbi:MAG: hypothetical protein JNN32_06980 [Flavobacteriales bacterium]|nr:hypothetical protein [Flavobacteriales bacterium]
MPTQDPSSSRSSPRALWALVLAGTAVRYYHGASHQLWNGAPDQLAWGLGLEDLHATGAITYEQLMHYPHEGGSLFLGLVALLFAPLSGLLPPLSWAALAVDTVARVAQIRVAQRLVDERTALWFAAWTVFAAPVMLPWGTVNFGLHAAFSFAPFLLAVMVSDPRRSVERMGLCCGLLASLAYDAWVFAPAFALLLVTTDGTLKTRVRHLLSFALACALGFLPHLLLRLFAQDGFGLEDHGALSIRGLEQEPVDISALPAKCWQVCTTALSASFTLGAATDPLVRALSIIVLAFLAAGAWGLRRQWASISPALRTLVYTTVVFVGVVIAAPFFQPRSEGSGYLYYRYFAFIAPLIALLVLHGAAALGRMRRAVSVAWITLGVLLSVVYMVRSRPITTPNMEATGWVLARKYGDRPAVLMRIIQRAPTNQHHDLVYGAGWGLTAALFDGKSIRDSAAVDTFEELWKLFPHDQRAALQRGVVRAFDTGITPPLDPALLPRLRERMEP